MEADPTIAAGTNESSAAVPESPFCGSLRSKKFFKFDALATSAEDYLDGSNHCWCRHTQLVVGPDGMQVDPHECTPARSCYTSALETS
jgi:hypothetical protein